MLHSVFQESFHPTHVFSIANVGATSNQSSYIHPIYLCISIRPNILVPQPPHLHFISFCFVTSAFVLFTPLYQMSCSPDVLLFYCFTIFCVLFAYTNDFDLGTTMLTIVLDCERLLTKPVDGKEDTDRRLKRVFDPVSRCVTGFHFDMFEGSVSLGLG